MSVRNVINSVVKSVRTASGTICAVTAVIGVGATIYFSGKAAVEVDHTIKPEMSKKEKAKVYLKAYWKTGIVGGSTVAAIVASDRFHVKKEIMFAGTAAMWKDKFVMLDSKAREKLGDDEINDIYRAIADEKVKEENRVPEEVEESGSKILYFYEPISKQNLDVSYEKLLEALLEVNFRLQRDMSVDFNVLLDYLDGICTDKTLSLCWDLNDDAQNYNASYAGAFVVGFTDEVWDEINYHLKSDKPMSPDDRITIHYLLYPDESLPWD